MSPVVKLGYAEDDGSRPSMRIGPVRTADTTAVRAVGLAAYHLVNCREWKLKRR
jgi:hypothetical protein